MSTEIMSLRNIERKIIVEKTVSSRGKLLWRTRFTVARGLRRSNLTVARGLRRTRFTSARGLRRTRFTVARGSCDRHLCRKRPPEELFYGRKRILYSIIV